MNDEHISKMSRKDLEDAYKETIRYIGKRHLFVDFIMQVDD